MRKKSRITLNRMSKWQYALLLLMLALPPFAFFIVPLMSGFSRRDEYQADAYACAQSSGNDLANALVKLYQDNASTLTPDPLYVRFHYSHPPASERLAAMGALTRTAPHGAAQPA